MTLILASRIYTPLEDVDPFVTRETVAFGETDIARRVESLGGSRLPLEQDRKTLLELAPGGDVVCFVANDPVTKQPSQGMAGIMAMLSTRDIPFTVVASPLPGSVCQVLFDLRTAVGKAVLEKQPRRRDDWLGKVLGYAGLVVDKRDEYERKLEEGFGFRVGDHELDEKWLRWLRAYESLCDGLQDARRVL